MIYMWFFWWRDIMIMLLFMLYLCGIFFEIVFIIFWLFIVIKNEVFEFGNGCKERKKMNVLLMGEIKWLLYFWYLLLMLNWIWLYFMICDLCVICWLVLLCVIVNVICFVNIINMMFMGCIVY